jgi:thiamine-phosphate pyrophosphorylase
VILPARTLEWRRQRLQSAVLYGILDTGYLAGRDPLAVVQSILAGGVDIVQVRAKSSTASEAARLARQVADAVRGAGALLILNDFSSAAREAGADGVHIGQEDGSVAEARAATGGDLLVGKSTHSLEQAVAGEEEGADYIGIGPLYATPTKPDYVPVGLPLIAQVKARVKIPQFCIGGVKLENLESVIVAGADRVVVVSGILQAADISAYCRALRQKLF